MALRNLPPARRQGLWTPTLTIVSGITALILRRGHFQVVGDFVLCQLAVNVDGSGVGEWEFRAGLPFGATIASVYDILGVVGAGQGTTGGAGHVSGNVATNEAFIQGAFGADVTLDTVAVFAYRAA